MQARAGLPLRLLTVCRLPHPISLATSAAALHPMQNLTVDQRIGGRTNHSPLTQLGEKQAQALGAHLRVRSPLSVWE